MVYEDYLSDIKATEDDRMLITRSGAQIYIGSAGKGEVSISANDGYHVSYLLEGPSGERVNRSLRLSPLSEAVAAPTDIIDLSTFGPLLSELMSQL